MRYWIIGLIALWAVWLYTKPNMRKLDARVDNAIALAADCKLGEAQGELIALRSGRATAAQVAHLQAAIEQATPRCEKKRARASAWTEAQAAAEGALDDGDAPRALTRLNQFTRRYGEDAATRALKARIGTAREAPARMAPSGALARQAQSARQLIDEADRDIKAGNYRAASNRMEACVAMIDGGSRECAAFKVYADRLQQSMQRCLDDGREWVGERCQ